MTPSFSLDEVATELAVMLRVSLAGLTDAEVLEGLAAVERVGRVVDAARVRFAGEVGARSRAELGDEGLSRSENFTSPAKLVSAITGVSVRDAAQRLALGGRLRGGLELGGGAGPEPFPAVSSALAAGVLAVESAAIITRHCHDLAQKSLPCEEIRQAEQTLVEETLNRDLTADQTAKLALHLRALLDPDGAMPREEHQQQLRSLTFFAPAPDGMLRGRFALTPEQAGIWVGSIDALQSPRVSGRGELGPRFASEAEAVTEAALADARTAGQKNVDTLTELLTRAAAAPEMPRLGGSATTVNVHVTLADLEEGRGVGWIDGITEPVSAATIAQLRCHSATVATVFGDHGEVLNHGKTRRLFSPAQNRALAARDGGCVWGDCDRPPSWCETHHVTEWVSESHSPGRTDIGNGVLLCHFHHSHLHRSSWALIMRGGVPHLVPPAWVDVGQTPIPTTRRRTTLGSHAVGAALRERAGSGRTRA